MPVSKNNCLITVKISKNTKDFIDTFCKKYNCSASSFAQYCITQRILTMDLYAESLQKEGKNASEYYYQMARYINHSYDNRRK